MKPGLKAVLEELQKVDISNLNTIFVPSVGDSIKYKPLTMHHQKTIIKSALDPSATNMDFNISINNILQDIVLDGNILVSDKPAVLVSLRSVNVGKIINIDTDESSVEVNLNSIISKYGAIAEESTIQYSKKVSHNDITVNMRIPTLDIDTRYMVECRKRIKGSTSPEDVSENISEMYVYEIAKFIESVQHTTYSEAESGKLVNTVIFNQITVKESIDIVELLPMSINKSISDYITAVRDEESKYVSVKSDVNIPTDATLFAIE
jgi:hypothetical protein